jgi:hypothetical protein
MFSNTGPEGEFPVRLDLVPGKLSAQVYLHDVKSVRRKIPCWTYVTDGLRERGQKEVVITLSREEDENASDFPRAPLKFFSHLYEFSEGGESVDVGDVTQFEGDGFMGRAGIVYAEPESLYGLELPSFSLAAVLLTEDELQAVHAFGATRVLALLGKAARHYPYPAWSDRSRPGLELTATLEQSVLAQIDRRRIPGLRVRVEGNRIVASVAPEAVEDLQTVLSRATVNVPLALPTDLDPVADGCLVWEPGHLEPTVAAPPGSRRTRLSGCFLALVPDQEEDCSEIVEDGMVVSFTDSSWLAVKGALETQAPITIPSTSGSLHFTLSWRQLL